MGFWGKEKRDGEGEINLKSFRFSKFGIVENKFYVFKRDRKGGQRGEKREKGREFFKLGIFAELTHTYTPTHSHTHTQT